MTGTKSVLVVDDEVYWRDRVSTAVKDCGLLPITATTFEGAARLLGRESFSLVITDNYMYTPNAGIELIQYMNRRLTKVPPTILHTSERPKELETLLRVFSWLRFVQKDRIYDDARLISTIQEILQ